MSFLVLRAYLMLILFDHYVGAGDFLALHTKVRTCPSTMRMPTPGTVGIVLSAVDMACIWYWKEVLCLQRSAVTAYLLKRQGVPAQMVIGVQQIPFKAHAWVEVDGAVVNDKLYTPEMYAALERF
jgi:Transglutaminase-like superfamily